MTKTILLAWLWLWNKISFDLVEDGKKVLKMTAYAAAVLYLHDQSAGVPFVWSREIPILFYAAVARTIMAAFEDAKVPAKDVQSVKPTASDASFVAVAKAADYPPPQP